MMPNNPTDINGMNITITKDGTATLSGINYDDLRSILTAASLYRGNEPFKAEVPKGDYASHTHKNNIDSLKWHLHQQFLLDVLLGRMVNAISPLDSNGDKRVRDAITIYEDRVANIENTLREAESKAAGLVEVIDPLVEINAAFAKATQDTDVAFAKLNQYLAMQRK